MEQASTHHWQSGWIPLVVLHSRQFSTCMCAVTYLLLFVLSLGNFMYFSATSKYMILGSRFIVGE